MPTPLIARWRLRLPGLQNPSQLRWVFIFIPPAVPAFFLLRCCDNDCKGFAEEHIMDYEFLRDVTGRVLVRMSMGHEVVGHWF
ncbi:YacL family protein, partial [Salmonella sp. SAL01998]|uniref:YacL family protein n=1 Tax=Salmonella sp. SAL01998 TaxID=3159757 RepID=UPI00397E844A